MNTHICIYHKDCADGFGAALAFKLHAEKRQINAEFIPAHYGDPAPENIDGKRVIILDFSYPRNVLLDMEKRARSLLVIDHHITAEKDLKGLEYCIFDQSKSGAVLAWEHFHTSDVPDLFQYIQDRDLWLWDLPYSKEVSAGLELLEKNFALWKLHLPPYGVEALINRGRIVLKYQQKQVEKIVSRCNGTENIAGYNVPCVNTTTMISETGHELAKGHPFAAMYFETDDKRIYSLRSAPDGIDVSAIAKKFGGGGHFHAAGFSIPKPNIALQLPLE